MDLKILLIDIQGWGGITHYTYNLMQALVRAGQLDCALLTDSEYELENYAPSFKVIKQPLKNQAYALAISRLIKTIFLTKPKILHVQTMITVRRDWFWFMIARLFGYKVIFTAHNILPHEEREQKAFLMKTALKIIYRCSSRIIVHSQYSRNRLIELFKINPAKIAVIAHGNYLFLRTKEITKQKARQLLGIPLDKKVILHFGALRYYKGIDILLEAFRKIRDVRSDVLFLLAGKPLNVTIHYFEEIIKRLGLTNDVILHARYIPLEEIQVYFYSSDIVVFPYREIDTSGSLQSAYAFAKPVIATDTGSMPEVIDDRQNGRLVTPGDPDLLIQAINEILSDSGKIEQMGDYSFKLALDKFSWGPIAQNTIQLYSSLL